MGGKTTVENKSSGTQTAAPPSWTMPGISDAASRVTAALAGLPGNKYEGNFVAAPNYDAAIAAYGGAANRSGEMSDFARSATTGYTPITANFGRDFSGLETSSKLPGAINAAIHPVQQQLLEQTLPGLRNSALESGAYSGDRAISTLPEMAIRDSNESQQRIAAQLGYQDLQDTANRNLQAYGLDTERGLGVANLGASQQENYLNNLPDLIDTIMRTSTGQGDILANSAALRQQQQQAGINNDMARNQYEWQYPFQGLDIASSLLGQLSGNYGTTTSNGTSTQTQSTSGLGPILQGALGLGSLVAGFPTGGGGNLMSSLFKGGAGTALKPTGYTP